MINYKKNYTLEVKETFSKNNYLLKENPYNFSDCSEIDERDIFYKSYLFIKFLPLIKGSYTFCAQKYFIGNNSGYDFSSRLLKYISDNNFCIKILNQTLKSKNINSVNY